MVTFDPMKITKKHLSNLFYIAVFALFLWPSSRIWIQRQIAFIPSVIDVEDREHISEKNWVLMDLEGNRVNLKDYKDQVIFVNFWATWCPPCRAELPYLEEFYQDYHTKIAFLLVSNEDGEIVENFFHKEQFDLPNYKSISRPPAIFLETNSIPASYIIDKKGRVAVAKTGAARWNSSFFYRKLDQILAE